MFQESFKGVSRHIEGVLEGVLSLYQISSKGASRDFLFQGCYKDVFRKLQGSFDSVLRRIEDFFE